MNYIDNTIRIQGRVGKARILRAIVALENSIVISYKEESSKINKLLPLGTTWIAMDGLKEIESMFQALKDALDGTEDYTTVIFYSQLEPINRERAYLLHEFNVFYSHNCSKIRNIIFMSK